MDAGLNPSELPATLSVIPGYPQDLVGKQLWMIVACQLLFCFTSSVWISYLLYKKLYGLGDLSWKKTVEIMGPISKRLQNLEKERAVWHCYLEWIEDYCTVYYGLLNYLNAAATDLDKICNNRNFSWKNLSDSSGLFSQTEGESTNEGETADEPELSSEVEWDKMTSAAGAKIFSSIGKFLPASKTLEQENTDNNDSTSVVSCGFDSKKGTGQEETSSEVPESDTSAVKKRRKRQKKGDKMSSSPTPPTVSFSHC